MSRLEALVLQSAQARKLVSADQVSSARAAHEAAVAGGEPSDLLAHLAEQLDPPTRASVRQIYHHALRAESDASETLVAPSAKQPLGQPLVETVAEPTPVEASNAPATIAVPGYNVTGELGRGGMGVVYGATREADGDSVAIKVLLAGEGATVEDLARFQTEAEAASRLEHPHIVALLEHGQAGGNPFMILEFVEGEDLDARIGREGKLDPEDAVGIAIGIADALAYAHEQGILHRDLKPQNVLLDSEGLPVLTDFGLAKLRGDAAPSVSLTQSGMLLGTPAYMAPEQANAERQKIDERTDVYGLGATLFHMLTGQRPFAGPTLASLIVKILNDPPPRLRSIDPDLDPDLETIVLKCLEKERSDRYASAGQLLRDLSRWQKDLAIVAAPPTLATRVQRVARKNPVAAGAASFAALVVVIAAVAVFFGLRSMQAQGELEAELAALKTQQEGDPSAEVEGTSQTEETPHEKDPHEVEWTTDTSSTPDPTPSEATQPPAEEVAPTEAAEPGETDPEPGPESEQGPESGTDPAAVSGDPQLPEPEVLPEPSPEPEVSPIPPTPGPVREEGPPGPTELHPPRNGVRPHQEPPPRLLQRLVRIAEHPSKLAYVTKLGDAWSESTELKLPIVVVALNRDAKIPTSAPYLTLLNQHAVVLLAQPAHSMRRPKPLQPCPEHRGLICFDHMFLHGLVKKDLGGSRNESVRLVIYRPNPNWEPPSGERASREDSDEAVLFEQLGVKRGGDFRLTRTEVKKALERAQHKIGEPAVPLEVLRKLGPHLSTLARFMSQRDADLRHSSKPVLKAASVFVEYANEEGVLGGFSRFGARGLCGRSVEIARETQQLEAALPILKQRFGEEPGCAMMLEEVARGLH